MDIDEIQGILEDKGIVFLVYGGLLSQTLIAGMTEVLEKEADENNLKTGVSNNIFTIFIEMSQNMMNYPSLELDIDKAEGIIVVGRKKDTYYVDSQNVVDKKEKVKIQNKLDAILKLSKDEIKLKYRELRKSGKNTHGNGGGIGFYEIAKRCNKLDYEFQEIDDNRYNFKLKTTIKTRG